MTTLIALYHGNHCTRRCDATCYNAKTKKCNCICSGKNHGVGKMDAIANNLERIDDLADDLRDADPTITEVRVRTHMPVVFNQKTFHF